MDDCQINRNLDCCMDCPNFLNVGEVFQDRNGDEHDYYFCRVEDGFIDNDGILVGLSFNCRFTLAEWNKIPVTIDCERYADYFVNKCNEKKH